MIEIVDLNGRKRLVKSIRVIDHEVRNSIHGGTLTEKYVEVVIVGRHRRRTWKEWYPLEKFKEMNPNLKI